ncbi:pleckstrin homology domain-containing family B member 1 [Hyperolius riggenbachi]|uniref:pleckstrin homology domain-containing family B member 1 n=1 Tax=Hyperolius riggenbachi TaxID=752182 RepID=UPI0035A27820
MALVKSGWLWRQSSVLRRWKKNWFDLWMDGGLVYYADDSRQHMEERIPLKYNCLNARSGQECGDLQPPEGSNRDSLLVVELRDRARLLLCAESEDDAVAWKIAIQDSRAQPVYVYNPYDDYYHAVPPNAHQSVYVNPGYCGHGYGPGMMQIMVRDERDTFGEQLALGLLAGAITSSALSSLIWLPCWF